MYVGVPKNYGGTAFAREKTQGRQPMRSALPPTLPHSMPNPEKEVCPEKPGCDKGEKNPIACLINAFKGTKDGAVGAEELLLICLIVLLIGKKGNEDIVFILAMLLLF